MSYQLKHSLIDGKGNELANKQPGQAQEVESLRRLIRIVFHPSHYKTLNLEEALSSELYNMMNGVDVGLRSAECDILVRNLANVHKFHQEKQLFCNPDKYNKDDEEHEKQLMQVRSVFNTVNCNILFSFGPF
jgi:hypothetical protein